MGILDKHSVLERNATILLVASLGVVSIGGIVEIAPLFYLENTIEEVDKAIAAVADVSAFCTELAAKNEKTAPAEPAGAL